MIFRDESTVRPSGRDRQEPWAASHADVAQRFAAARRSGRPAWLWPEVELADWRRALHRIADVVSDVVQDRRPAPLACEASGDPVAFCVAAYTSGLGPWLGRQVEAGRLEAEGGLAAVFAAHLEHGRHRWRRLEKALQQAAHALHGAGIEAAVVKGAVTARRCFEEPGLRPMADLDIVVGVDALERAGGALARAGFAERAAGRLERPPRREWRAPGSTGTVRSVMLVHADDPVAVDLHGGLAIDFFGVRTVAFGEPSTWRFASAGDADLPLRAPAEPLLTAHVAVHASHGLHGLTLVRLLELVLLLRAAGSAGAQALADLLRELEAERFAWPALALAERLVPGTVDARLLARCAAAAPPRLRRVVTETSPAGAQRLDRLALEERFMWGSGPLEHARRVRTMLLPPGTSGSIRRLGGVYFERLHRLLRLRVGWRSERPLA